jgi:pyocin large subunit-like protein
MQEQRSKGGSSSSSAACLSWPARTAAAAPAAAQGVSAARECEGAALQQWQQQQRSLSSKGQRAQLLQRLQQHKGRECLGSYSGWQQ